MKAQVEYAILFYATRDTTEALPRSVKIIPGMDKIRFDRWPPLAPVKMGQGTWDRLKSTVDQLTRKRLSSGSPIRGDAA